MRVFQTGTLTLPDGTVCKVTRTVSHAGKSVIRYEAPAPWAPGTWFVVPTNVRHTITWKD